MPWRWSRCWCWQWWPRQQWWWLWQGQPTWLDLQTFILLQVNKNSRGAWKQSWAMATKTHLLWTPIPPFLHPGKRPNLQGRRIIQAKKNAGVLENSHGPWKLKPICAGHHFYPSCILAKGNLANAEHPFWKCLIHVFPVAAPSSDLQRRRIIQAKKNAGVLENSHGPWKLKPICAGHHFYPSCILAKGNLANAEHPFWKCLIHVFPVAAPSSDLQRRRIIQAKKNAGALENSHGPWKLKPICAGHHFCPSCILAKGNLANAEHPFWKCLIHVFPVASSSSDLQRRRIIQAKKMQGRLKTVMGHGN